MEIPLLQDIVTIFGLSIIVLLICSRLRIPAVVGLLITGVICGPHGLQVVNATHEVEILAEIGIVLLLFTIGLEFSLSKLMQIKKLVLAGGSIQVVATLVITALIAYAFDYSFNECIFFGFLISLSSTAIILKLLQEKAQMSSPHGQTILAILIFQDIAVVPMMLLTPFLAKSGDTEALPLLIHLGKGLLILFIVLLLARWGIPRLLFLIAKTRNTQLFILCVLFICFAVAWLTSSVGLSLALGAFLAGLIISESEYSHHTVGHIFPFQQIFTSFFFVSIGMLLDIGFILDHPLATFLTTILILLLKFIAAGSVSLIMAYPIKTAIIVGLGLCQVGEFAFILSTKGTMYNLISGTTYQLFLAVSLVTMALSPLLLAIAPKIADYLLKFQIPDRLKYGKIISKKEEEKSKDHVVIIGFGVCGRNVAWAAKLANVPYNIIEMNPETVLRERKEGELIFFGDATQEAVVEQTNIKYARIAVIAINDPIATRRMVEEIRKLSPKIYIIARTRFLKELEPMLALGANDVIPEEFETSLEIFTRVLRKYLIPTDEIEKFSGKARTKAYEQFRSLADRTSTLKDLNLSLADIEIVTLRLPANSSLIGTTLQTSNLRNQFGITVLMIRRADEIITNPKPDTIIKDQDLLVIFGETEQLTEFSDYFINK